MEDWDPFPNCPVDQRVQKKSNSGRFCAEETREAQQLREQRALESAANVNYKEKKRDVLGQILYLVLNRGNSTR